MKTAPARFFLVFALFWSALVLVFDIVWVRTFIHQIGSLRYATAPGLIVSSEVTENTGSDDGLTYGAKIVYEFQAHGLRYQSARVRFGQMSESGGRWARETVNAYPAGAACTVYYDPSDPREAVLQTGVAGHEWFLALFLTPFNIAMGFLWWAAVAARRPSPPRGGARIVPEAGRILVYLGTLPSAALVLATFGAVSFAGIFALVIPWEFSPPPEYVWAVWAAAGVAAFFAWKRGGKTSKPSLIFDADRGLVSLPKGPFNTIKNWSQWQAWKKAGRPPLEIPLERIRSAHATKRVTQDSEGTSTTYVVTLAVEEPGATAPYEYDVGSWMLPSRAEAFAAWLRETLALPPATT